MNTEQKIYVGLGVLAIAAGALYLNRKNDAKDATVHSVTAASADFPAIAVPKDDIEKITKLEVTTPKKDDKEKVTIVLEKKEIETMIDKIKAEIVKQNETTKQKHTFEEFMKELMLDEAELRVQIAADLRETRDFFRRRDTAAATQPLRP